MASALPSPCSRSSSCPLRPQAACGNPVACENTLAGTPQSVWEIDGAGDTSIQGFATSMSVNKGDSIGFKIKSATSNYTIDILRLGYYDGDGARMIASNLAPTGHVDPAGLPDVLPTPV